jgi:RimJ/RimL family protein N-acetyltransferase
MDSPASVVNAELYLDTGYERDTRGRITSTREPTPKVAPEFVFVRDLSGSRWAIGATVPDRAAEILERLAVAEPRSIDIRTAPAFLNRYAKQTGGTLEAGPAFLFPETLRPDKSVQFVEQVESLQRYFEGWSEAEIPGRQPIAAIVEGGQAISVCCSARLSDAAAEAGLETGEGFRGRGLGARVAAAWAKALRESGRVPLYSTTWENAASLAVARKLGLAMYANVWNFRARGESGRAG